MQNATLSKITLKHVEKLVHQSTGEMMPNAELTVHQDQLTILLTVTPKKHVKAHELLLLKAKLLKVKFFKTKLCHLQTVHINALWPPIFGHFDKSFSRSSLGTPTLTPIPVVLETAL